MRFQHNQPFQDDFRYSAANLPMRVIPSNKHDVKILDANDAIKAAKNPIVIVTEDFLNNYGYAALGWFSKGIPFVFESQRARDMVPSDYGQWVDAPVNGYSKIFDPLQSCSADKIIIVGKPSGITTNLIERYAEIREKQINLCDITSDMRAFNFEPLRPKDPKENTQTMTADPRSNMDLCRSANSGSKTQVRRRRSKERHLCV